MTSPLFGPRRRPRVRLPRQPQENPWYVFILLALLFLYWLFVRYVEQMDLAVTGLRWWVSTPIWPEPPPVVVFVAEMLHWRVLRHFIPVAVGWWFAYRAAVGLVQLLYDLPDRAGAQRFLRRLRTAASGVIRPTPIPAATLEEERPNSVLLRVGGPGYIEVLPGNVAVTELNGRFLRILPAGRHVLIRYEYIHTVLDLQPQERPVHDVQARTRDGIPITAHLHIVYRIHTGPEPVTKANPYPFDETAVRTAAYTQVVLDGGKVTTWENGPVNMAKGVIRGIIAGYKLNEIIYPERQGDEPFITLNNQLLHKLRTRLDDIGVDLQSAAIARLDLPDEVTAQYIEYWQSHWNAQIRLSQADSEATAVEEIEIARAEAEITMIQAILEGVKRARRAGATTHMDEIIALRLVEALEKMAHQSQQVSPLPPQLLPQLDDIRRQIAARSQEARRRASLPAKDETTGS